MQRWFVRSFFKYFIGSKLLRLMPLSIAGEHCCCDGVASTIAAATNAHNHGWSMIGRLVSGRDCELKTSADRAVQADR